MRTQTEYMRFEIFKQYVVAMISRCTCNVPKDNVLFPDWVTVIRGAPRCSQACRSLSQAYRWCFQTCCPRSQACCQPSQTLRQRSLVLPRAHMVLSGALRCSQSYHNGAKGTAIAVKRGPSDSEARQEYPPTIWCSPAIDSSQFTLHILSDSPGRFQ